MDECCNGLVGGASEFAKVMIAKGEATGLAKAALRLSTSTVPPPLGECGPSCELKSDASCGGFECWMRFFGGEGGVSKMFDFIKSLFGGKKVPEKKVLAVITEEEAEQFLNLRARELAIGKMTDRLIDRQASTLKKRGVMINEIGKKYGIDIYADGVSINHETREVILEK